MRNVKKPYLYAITFLIAGLMITSAGLTVTSTAKNVTQAHKKNIEIIPKDKMCVAASELMPLQQILRTKVSNTPKLLSGTDVPIFSSDLTNQNPGIATDGFGNILVMSEETDGTTTNLWGRWSTDSGNNWVDESQIMGWQLDTLYTWPELDYYGKGKTAWGTITPGLDSGIVNYIGLPDITDPTIPDPNNPDGWTDWYVDWGGSQLSASNVDSTDVACYSDTSNIPNPEFWGLVALTGDQAYPGYEEDNTMMFSYMVSGGQVQIIFFYNMSEDVFNMKTEIDQSNARFYMVMGYQNNVQHADGSEVVYTNVSTDPNWWQTGWGGFYFEGLSNADVVTFNKNCYIVGEKINGSQKDIVCLRTSNNVYNFTESVVSDNAADELYPTVAIAEGINGPIIVCSYLRGGNLYVSTSIDGGVTWDEQENPINDQTGTVVNQYDTASLDGRFSVWTDKRNTPSEIYFDTTVPPIPKPILNITSIKGGLGVSANIENIGDADATNVVWTIIIKGGIFGLINKTVTDTIASLAVGASEPVKTGMIFGLGTITITATATCAEGRSIGPINKEGIQIAIFTIVK